MIMTSCPHCLRIRKASFAALINLETGAYNCKTCHSSGTWKQFTKALKNKIHERDAISNYSLETVSDTLGTTPRFTRPLDEIKQYPSRLTDEDLKALSSKYKLEPDIIRKYNVGLGEYDEKTCLTFPQTALLYTENDLRAETTRVKATDFDNPEDVVAMDPPTANMSAPAGLFGYHTIPVEADTVIITRTELDAMAAHQATGISSVSLPTSTYQLQEQLLPLLERFSHIYIWMDGDIDGELAAERFAYKLGEARCSIVDSEMSAHEALISGENLLESIQSANRLKHEEIMEFTDLRDLVHKEILYPEQTHGVQSIDLPSFNAILKGHRPGELTILTGPTGMGKTTIISQLSLDFCKSGVPTLWGSFEILNRRLAKKMLYQYAGKDLSKTPEEFDSWANKFEQLPLYFLKFFSSTAVRDVLDACRHAVYAYDVRHIILDNLQFMLSQQGRSHQDRWELQDDAIAELRRFATEQDVHITLVVHPRKDTGELLDISSVFGSAKVTQEADNVIILQKTEKLRWLDIRKNRSGTCSVWDDLYFSLTNNGFRYDGTLGQIYYQFDPMSFKIDEISDEARLEILNNNRRSFSQSRVLYRAKSS
ncbi:P-loop containing nucleoside triphosphate hydrolase protein [Dichotomocladium elegans]|nr:P-loop containing nucleoside triphosphate hydrolase protein [Dichotomocladium elegans]